MSLQRAERADGNDREPASTQWWSPKHVQGHPGEIEQGGKDKTGKTERWNKKIGTLCVSCIKSDKVQQKSSTGARRQQRLPGNWMTCLPGWQQRNQGSPSLTTQQMMLLLLLLHCTASEYKSAGEEKRRWRNDSLEVQKRVKQFLI